MEIIIPGFKRLAVEENPHHANSGDRRVRIEVDSAMSISDGYHTFGELHEHRILLFLAFLKAHEPSKVFKARKHQDGSAFEGWFLVCAEIDGEQISYHLPNKYWDHAWWIPGREIAPIPWDGHTSNDVLERLRDFIFEGQF